MRKEYILTVTLVTAKRNTLSIALPIWLISLIHLPEEIIQNILQISYRLTSQIPIDPPLCLKFKNSFGLKTSLSLTPGQGFFSCDHYCTTHKIYTHSTHAERQISFSIITQGQGRPIPMCFFFFFKLSLKEEKNKQFFSTTGIHKISGSANYLS